MRKILLYTLISLFITMCSVIAYSVIKGSTFQKNNVLSAQIDRNDGPKDILGLLLDKVFPNGNNKKQIKDKPIGKPTLTPSPTFTPTPPVFSVTPSPSPTATPTPVDNNFVLYTRVTSVTWPHISQYMQKNDLFWGKVDTIPVANRALTISNYTALQTRGSDQNLKNYSAINLDGEYQDYDLAYTEAKQIRDFVDSYNTRHKNDTANYPYLKFIAFYHLNIINAHNAIVSYPDIVLFGKSNWDADNMISLANPYISTINSYNRKPAVALGAYKSVRGSSTKVPYTSDEIIANFKTVFMKPPSGLGLSTLSFYYDADDDSTLIATLKVLRETNLR